MNRMQISLHNTFSIVLILTLILKLSLLENGSQKIVSIYSIYPF